MISRAVLLALVALPAAVLAAVPSSVSTGLSDALTDAAAVAASVFLVLVAIAAFRWMRVAIDSGGYQPMSRKEQADEIRALRRDGWTNSEIRLGGRDRP